MLKRLETTLIEFKLVLEALLLISQSAYCTVRFMLRPGSWIANCFHASCLISTCARHTTIWSKHQARGHHMLLFQAISCTLAVVAQKPAHVIIACQPSDVPATCHPAVFQFQCLSISMSVAPCQSEGRVWVRISDDAQYGST